MATIGDKDTCEQCGWKIHFDGTAWRHSDKHSRHIATPKTKGRKTDDHATDVANAAAIGFNTIHTDAGRYPASSQDSNDDGGANAQSDSGGAGAQDAGGGFDGGCSDGGGGD